jgi:hypothetical protein
MKNNEAVRSPEQIAEEVTCPYCGAPPKYKCDTPATGALRPRPHAGRITVANAFLGWMTRRLKAGDYRRSA